MDKLRIIFVISGTIALAGLLYIFGIAPEKIVEEPSISPPLFTSVPMVSQIPGLSAASTTLPAVNRMHRVTIKTNLGDIIFETYDADAPKTVQNFITLAQKGFYNNLTFYRMVRGFMIEGGDPNGNGTGGPGYMFEDELNPKTESYKKGYVKGAVVMSNAGPNTNGSRFFIMLEYSPVPHTYTIFGQVISGQHVVDAIGHMDTNEANKLLNPVVIEEIMVGSK